MAKGIVTIEGVPQFDGVYELDYDGQSFSMWDLHMIKKIAGVRAAEFKEATDAGDTDVTVALAVIALRRAGKFEKNRALEVADLLMESEAGKIRYHEEDDAEVPPPEASPSEPAPRDGHAGSSTVSSPVSNGTGDDRPVIIPPLTGHPV